MNNGEAKLQYDSEGYYNFIIEIINTFEEGALITHDWMRKKLMFEDLSIAKFDSFADLMKAIELQQFEYMFIIDKIRWDMLKIHKKFLKNVRGEGYTILPQKDQVNYAFTKAVKEVKKTIKQSFMMMDNLGSNDMELRAKNTANRVKLSMLRQMLGKNIE